MGPPISRWISASVRISAMGKGALIESDAWEIHPLDKIIQDADNSKQAGEGDEQFGCDAEGILAVLKVHGGGEASVCHRIIQLTSSWLSWREFLSIWL